MILKTIKKILLRNPLIHANMVTTNLETRPTTIRLISAIPLFTNNSQKIVLGICLSPFILLILASLFQGLFEGQLESLAVGLIMVGLIWLAWWIIRIRNEMVWQVTWYDHHVELQDGRYGPTNSWEIPLTEFTHIELKTKRTFNRYALTSSRRTTRYFGLMLVHPNGEKSFYLHVRKQSIPQQTVDQYANSLQLPVKS